MKKLQRSIFLGLIILLLATFMCSCSPYQQVSSSKSTYIFGEKAVFKSINGDGRKAYEMTVKQVSVSEYDCSSIRKWGEEVCKCRICGTEEQESTGDEYCSHYNFCKYKYLLNVSVSINTESILSSTIGTGGKFYIKDRVENKDYAIVNGSGSNLKMVFNDLSIIDSLVLEYRYNYSVGATGYRKVNFEIPKENITMNISEDDE